MTLLVLFTSVHSISTQTVFCRFGRLPALGIVLVFLVFSGWSAGMLGRIGLDLIPVVVEVVFGDFDLLLKPSLLRFAGTVGVCTTGGGESTGMEFSLIGLRIGAKVISHLAYGFSPYLFQIRFIPIVGVELTRLYSPTEVLPLSNSEV